VDGRWIDLDPTPPDWFGEESSRLAPAWEGVADLLRWAAYRWSQREELQASDAWWGVLAVLVVILGWRLLRGKHVLRDAGTANIEAALPCRYGDDHLITITASSSCRQILTNI